eukprot:261500_1
MNESIQRITLLSMAAFGLLQLIFVLFFWYCHLRHHQNRTVYRIRHPIFWTFCMVMSSSQIIWKALVTDLHLNDHIDGKLYQVLNQIGVLLIGHAGVYARKILVPHTGADDSYALTYVVEDPLQPQTSSEDTFLYTNEKKMSNPIHAFAWLQSLYIVLTFIGALLTVMVSETASKYYIISVAMLFWFILTIFVYATWINGRGIKYKIDGKRMKMSTRFVDHFNFRWEVTIIWLDVLVFVPLRSWISAKYKTDVHTSLVWLAFLTLLSQFFPTLAQIVVPYWTYARSASSLFRKSSNEVTVFDVLNDKHGFFLFVNHAVQELNFENISCLIAIYQFKHLKTSKDQMASPITKKTIEDSIQVQDLECGQIQVLENVNSIRAYSSNLIGLQWNDLPLTESVSNMADSKYEQAQNIYFKYFGTGSIYTVNVSGDVRDFVRGTFVSFQENYEKDKDIHQTEEFEHALMEVFDIALPDLCNNLMDMMARFRATTEFRSLSIA